ncbi:MAG TPA: muconate/chloromuconate family cycloisomerase [Polyangiaceae bacterium]|nr:muconate/chloromuconate family cycloisomerase [Polyangiaceae bacterium]
MVSVNGPDAIGDGLWNLGNAHLGKRSTLETFVPWAEAREVRFVPNTTAARLQLEGRRAKGVVLRSLGGGLSMVRVRKAVIVSGGVIASSHFLMRSGLGRPVGLNMSCNFALPAAFEFDEELLAFYGEQITPGATEAGNRAIFETYFNPPGALALTIPFFFDTHREILGGYARMVNFGALVGAEPNGIIDLRLIAPDTLVIAGASDPSTPPERAQEILGAIRSMVREPSSVLLEAAHLSNAEQPEHFSAAVLDFLERPARSTTDSASARRARREGHVRVEQVEAILVDLPTIRRHELAMTTLRSQTVVLVRVRASDGIVGVGEGTTIGGLSYGEESPEGIRLAVDTYLAPALSGADPTDVARAMDRLALVAKGNHFAKCAIETALLDAAGRRAGLPLAELLGGRRHEQLEVAWTLASGDTQRDIAEAEDLLERRRHRIFKLKIGARSVAEDVRHVAALKRALGERASVRVDVNQAWDESAAMRGIAALEAAGVDLVEQPVARSNLRAMQRIASRFIVPILADESLHGPESAFELAVQAAADAFAVKISPSGGIRAAARVAAIAEAAGIGLYGGTMLESGLGTAAAAHLCATFRRLEWGTELFGPLLLSEEILREPLSYRDFSLIVPTGPGLGVELDDERVEAFRRDRRSNRAYGTPTSGGE